MIVEMNHKGMTISVYDRYGLVDIRTEENTRNAQICRYGTTWEAHLYWSENDMINKHHKVLTSENKEEAIELGKEWVTKGQH